jgi:hypothetical protein
MRGLGQAGVVRSIEMEVEPRPAEELADPQEADSQDGTGNAANERIVVVGKAAGCWGHGTIVGAFRGGDANRKGPGFCRVRAQSTLSVEPELKQTLWDVFEQIERLRDEYIVRLEFRHGLPILVETTAPAHFSK